MGVHPKAQMKAYFQDEVSLLCLSNMLERV